MPIRSRLHIDEIRQVGHLGAIQRETGLDGEIDAFDFARVNGEASLLLWRLFRIAWTLASRHAARGEGKELNDVRSDKPPIEIGLLVHPLLCPLSSSP
jgi:hypothetical protein